MYHKQSYPHLGDHISTVLKIIRLTKSIICSNGMGGRHLRFFKKGEDMHLSMYVHLLDIIWDHLDDEERFRQLVNEGVERYIAEKREKGV